MSVNKVYLGDRVLIDLTQDTVKPNNLEKGKTAHDSSGSIITGTLELPSGTLQITENGTFTVKQYENVVINVPIPEGYIKPSGNLQISSNGEYTVTTFDKAIVDVPIPEGYVKPEGIQEITSNGQYDVTNVKTVDVDIEVGVFPSGSLEIIENGTYDISGYESVTVNVPIPAGYVKPEGTLTLTENGATYDVTNYSSAKVSVVSMDTFDATATANDILLGKTAYVNNEKIEGTIETFDGSMIGASEVEFETWTFTLDDGTIIEKKVLAGDLDD